MDIRRTKGSTGEPGGVAFVAARRDSEGAGVCVGGGERGSTFL